MAPRSDGKGSLGSLIGKGVQTLGTDLTSGLTRVVTDATDGRVQGQASRILNGVVIQFPDIPDGQVGEATLSVDGAELAMASAGLQAGSSISGAAIIVNGYYATGPTGSNTRLSVVAPVGDNSFLRVVNDTGSTMASPSVLVLPFDSGVTITGEVTP